MKPIKLVVAGAGVIGKTHIDLIVHHERSRLMGIVDPSPAAESVARTLGVIWRASLPDFLAHEKPDGVILATPNQLHVDQALACIERGIPVFIEKPVAHTVAEGERLLQAQRLASVPALVGHHRAHSPVLAKARDIIRQGRLGRIVSVMGSALFFKPDDYFETGEWRKHPGGGPILINMIHEIGNLRSLCGEIVEVQAMTSRSVRGFDVEDTASINLRFANGALGTFTLSDTAASARSWEQTSQENKHYASYDDEDCYVIAGDMGTLSVPTMRLKYYASQSDRSWFKPFLTRTETFTRQDPLALQLDHFCDVIEGKATPLVTVHDGLQNLKVVEAIAQAAATGTSVRID